MGVQLRLASGWRGLTLNAVRSACTAVLLSPLGSKTGSDQFILPRAGPILAQTAVPVKGTDTPQQLAARVLVEVCCASRRVLENERSSTSCFRAPATSHLTTALHAHAPPCRSTSCTRAASRLCVMGESRGETMASRSCGTQNENLLLGRRSRLVLLPGEKEGAHHVFLAPHSDSNLGNITTYLMYSLSRQHPWLSSR